MQRCSRAGILLLITVLVSPVVAAQDFTVDVTVENQEVNAGESESARFNISVTNNGDTEKRFTIDYAATKPSWYFLHPYTLDVGPGETGYATIYADPDPEAVTGNKGINIEVTSEDGESIEKRAFFTVRQEHNILITDFSTDNSTYQPGSNVTVTATVRNVMNRRIDRNEYLVRFALDGREDTVPVSNLDSSESEELTTTFTLGQRDAGVMRATAAVEKIDGGTETTTAANIKVAETANVEKNRDNAFRLVSSMTTVTARNTGNVAAEDATITVDVPWYLSYFVSFNKAPAQELASDGAHIYRWDVGRLPAGAAYSVTYHVNYWVPATIILVLLGLAAVAVWEHRRPRIVKKSLRKEGKNSVHLRVENRSGSVIDNVVVKDFVPGIASLIEKFDSSPPEKIREGDEGTEIEWRLGRMTPGEERILTYQVSPQVQVEGSVTLPAALLSYKKGETEKKRKSHHAQADFQ